ncbi:hypothetical protein ACIP4S_03965 [Streptomyces chartreusis]|uniref:hypothetical protein n=1 Tax=Streptomyces chartreusis TaxID=1969 RepID=UPI0038112592
MMLPQLTEQPWGDTMRIIAAGLAAAALLTLTACEGTSDTGSSKPDTASADTSDQTKRDADAAEAATDEPTEAPADDAGAGAEAESATLPNLVGQDLQAAQDAAQAAGFYVLDDPRPQGRDPQRHRQHGRREPGLHSSHQPHTCRVVGRQFAGTVQIAVSPMLPVAAVMTSS